ncbi:hypothetical protein E2C01_017615 [Portunus trituberculatus]|uniref:Uncharacterized protein n=1 Tax=Portunus trituberculatus TaxID=210409 RepID=A0A5B7DS86_PORTR|nr:hypothetical protein [Portunus trituberculatus]
MVQNRGRATIRSSLAPPPTGSAQSGQQYSDSTEGPVKGSRGRKTLTRTGCRRGVGAEWRGFGGKVNMGDR